MFRLTTYTQVLIATEPVDFRKQWDGLIALCEQYDQVCPRSGCLFAFINRARTMIRILVYEHNGYWLATKRLSLGRYHHWPKKGSSLLPAHATDLLSLLHNNLEQTHKFDYNPVKNNDCEKKNGPRNTHSRHSY